MCLIDSAHTDGSQTPCVVREERENLPSSRRSAKKNNQSRLLIGLILMCAPAPTLNTTCGLYSTHTRHSFLCIGGIVTLLPNVNSIRQNQITPKQSVKRYDSRVWRIWRIKKNPNRNHMLIDVYIEEHGKRKETRLSCICKTHLLAHT